MNSTNKITSAVIWSVLVQIVQIIYGFISVPILLNYFGKSEYGLIGLATSVNVYIQLVDLGLNSTNIRFFSAWIAQGHKEKTRKLFQNNLLIYGAIGILNAVVLLIILFFSNQIFNLTPEQDKIIKRLFLILAGFAFINWLSSCFDQYVRATENVAWLMKRTLVAKIMTLVILFATIIFKLSIIEYFIFTYLPALCIIPFTILKIRKGETNISFIPSFDKKIIKEVFPYSLNIFSFGIFQFSFFQLRPVFLGIQCSPDIITDYNIMNGIAAVVTSVGNIFSGALFPSSAKIVAQKNRDAYYKIAYKGTKYVAITYCFCTFGLTTVMKDLLSIYVGEKFLYLLPWIYIWLFFSLGGHNKCISSLILSGTDVRAITYISIFSSIIGLIVIWFTIPLFSYGAPVIGLITYTISQQSFFYLYYWPKVMKINSKKVFISSLFPFILTGILCALLCKHFPQTNNNYINIVYLGSLFTFLYIIGVYLFLDREDKKFFIEIFSKKIKLRHK